MENKKSNGRKPDYKGNLDVAGWINIDKNGKKYISLRIGNSANLFKNEPKPKKQEIISNEL
ncbi:hypothetical protein HYV88_01540 [Candidatus Woesearchaeota archaeon]|nr:hypothetical protein [Candidatus Woesearchaeota archaeon]